MPYDGVTPPGDRRREQAMTYEYDGETETRRASRGAKVLIFGFSIFAVLGAFWTVVWFIRSYVEQPRIAARAPIMLASRDSEPAPAPRDPIATAAMVAPTSDPAPAPRAAAPPETPAATAQATPPAADPAPNSPIADRWFPTTPSARWPDTQNNAATAPAAAPAVPTDQTAATPENEQVEPEVVVASMEPAIRGVVPRPRPKPPTNTVSARLREPPLPRPRPDGSAPASVWTATPVTDDRFPQSSQ
jgi:hypothetical protein